MSKLFTWKPAFDLGIKYMNDEHKVLIQLMDKLHQQHKEGADYNILKAAIEELQDYTIKHFEDEEQLMESMEYPDLKVHKLIHQDLLKKFGNHKEKFLSSKTMDESFFGFLQLWLSAHIQGIDMKYSDHMKSGTSAA